MKHRIITITLIIIIFIASLYFIFLLQDKRSDVDCSAVVFHAERYSDDKFSYLSTHKILIKDGEMIDRINGMVYSSNQSYTLNRTVFFSHKPVTNSPGSYVVNVKGVRKSGADNVPDELADKYMSFTGTGNERTVHLTTIPTGDLLFTTALGPFFICDVNGDHK